MPKKKRKRTPGQRVFGRSSTQTQAELQEHRRRANQGPAIHEAKTKAEEALAQTFDPATNATPILNAIKTVDGTGSGLDADTLDGQDASAFATSGHTHGGASTVGIFKAVKSSSQGISSGGSSTKVFFSTPEYNPDGWYDNSFARYTPQQAGWYWIGAAATPSASVASQRMELWIRKNGTDHVNIDLKHTSNTAHIVVAGSAIVEMNGSSDYVEIFLFHTFGTTATIIVSSGTYFTGYKI